MNESTVMKMTLMLKVMKLMIVRIKVMMMKVERTEKKYNNNIFFYPTTEFKCKTFRWVLMDELSLLTLEMFLENMT